MRPKGTKVELEMRRRNAVALLLKGLGVRKVACMVGASPGAVSRWKDTYERAGEEGLRAKPQSGAKPKLSAKCRKRLERILLKGPLAQGYRTDLWTLRRVGKVIEKRFGVKYHPGHVWRVLLGMNWSCQKPERLARERNEEAIERWRKKDWLRIKKSP